MIGTQITLGDGIIAMATFSGALGATWLANRLSRKGIEESVTKKVGEQVQVVTIKLTSLEEQRRQHEADSKERDKSIHELELKMVELVTFQKNSEEKMQLLMSMYQNFLSIATAAQLRSQANP